VHAVSVTDDKFGVPTSLTQQQSHNRISSN